LARVELPELRTSHSKTFRLDDGRLQVELSAKWPIHYLDANGLWQDCDPALRSDTRVSEYDLACRKTWSSVTRLAKRSPQPVRIERGGCKLTYRAQGVANVQGVVEGNKLFFADAWPDADLIWYAVPEGLRKEIVLKSPSAPASYSFLVELQDLELRQDDDGVVRAWAGPFPAFEIYRPWVHDANGVYGPATVALRTEGGKQYLDLAIDPAWLSDPARVFPVVLDPTVIQPDAAAGKDTYVNSGSPTSNYGTSNAMYCGLVTPTEYRALIQFDLSGISSPFRAADIHLYTYWAGSGTTVSIHKVTSSWDEATVTWGTQPSFDGTALDTEDVSVIQWDIWSILALAEGWRNGSITNNGALLKLASGTSYCRFYSSDEVTNPTLRPKFVYELDVVPVATPTSPTGTEASPGTVADDVSPTLAWSYSDSEGDPQAKYQVQLQTADGLSTILDTGEVASANAYHNCSANLLDYGTDYRWRVRVHDGYGWGSWSAWQYFECILSAPTGLTATPDSANAEIDLSWAAHAGEDLAGYHVYRKLQGAGDATYTRLDLTLVTSTTYTDDTAASGTAYTYAVTAVADDGYESAKSAGVNGTVVFSGYWVGAVQVKLRPGRGWEHVRRTSENLTLTGTANVQDYGYGPRRVRLTLRYDSQAERQSLLDLFPAGQAVSYRDEQGFVLRGKVSGNVDETIIETPETAHGWLTFTLTETEASV